MKPSSAHILLLLLLLVVPAAISSSDCNFPALVNFGDSNSDTGAVSAAFLRASWPNGETFFKMPAGRASDGRLIIDFIAERLGSPLLSAYLDSLGANFSNGVNFAVGGAAITHQNYSPFPLDVQIRQVLQFNNRSQVLSDKGGVFAGLLPKKNYLSQALYTLDIGHNDVNEAYVAGRSPEEFIPKAMDGFSKAVKSIYDEVGGRSFWIHNSGPLGCLPFLLVTQPVPTAQLDSVGCAVPLNDLTQQFNRNLKETVAQLKRDFPLATFTYVDVYSVKYSLFKNAQKIGFEHPFTVCCGYGGGEYNLNPAVICSLPPVLVNGTLAEAKSCDEPSKRIIWDGIHYTEAGNKWVFDQIANGKFSDPPVSLRMACRQNAP